MNIFELLRLLPLRAPEGGGGGGGDGGAGGGGGNGDGGAGSGGNGDGGAGGGGGNEPSPYRPDGLPEHLAGASDKETIDRLHDAYSGARRELSTRGVPPENVEEYTLDLAGTPAEHLAIGADDPALTSFRGLAKEFGLTKEQFGIVPKFLAQAVESGLIDKPMSPQELAASLAPADFRGDDAARIAAGEERQRQAGAFATLFAANHKLDDAARLELQSLTYSPAGLAVLEAMNKAGMQTSVQTGGAGASGVPSADDLRRRQADPRNDRTSPKYDPNFAKQTRELYKQVHGN